MLTYLWVPVLILYRRNKHSRRSPKMIIILESLPSTQRNNSKILFRINIVFWKSLFHSAVLHFGIEESLLGNLCERAMWWHIHLLCFGVIKIQQHWSFLLIKKQCTFSQDPIQLQSRVMHTFHTTQSLTHFQSLVPSTERAIGVFFSAILLLY